MRSVQPNLRSLRRTSGRRSRDRVSSIQTKWRRQESISVGRVLRRGLRRSAVPMHVDG
jgi:hypothetical protein